MAHPDIQAEETVPGLNASAVVSVALDDLFIGECVRSSGVDESHVNLLVNVGDQLPPILVQAGSMRVIDGAHRVRAARLSGKSRIDVQLLDIDDTEAFTVSITANVRHGLPLSLADRKQAAVRLAHLRPTLSDRAIGRTCGLTGKTVAALRARHSDTQNQALSRIGLDGRVRPTDSADRRQTARRLIMEAPTSSLRDIATEAGLSPNTVRKIRNDLKVSSRQNADFLVGNSSSHLAGEVSALSTAVDILVGLQRDPSLRYQEDGRDLLRRLLLVKKVIDQIQEVVDSVPDHCLPSLAAVARIYGQRWLDLAGAFEMPKLPNPRTSSASSVQPRNFRNCTA